MKEKNINKNFPFQGLIQIIFVIVLIYIQIKICYTYWNGINLNIKYLTIIIEVFKILTIIHIILKLKSTEYKLLWLLLLNIFPVPAIICYILFGYAKLPAKFKNKLKEETIKFKEVLKVDEKSYEELVEIDKLKYSQANYILNVTGHPIYKNSGIEYFDVGEKLFNSVIEEVNKAKKYIFLEWFTIANGNMWDTLYNALKQKSREGIQVFLIVDGMIPKDKQPNNFRRNLEAAGIKYSIFNPINININSYINHRDHRKIVVIDGEIAYNCGLNIGDEYINLYPKLGHWKDTGIKILGEAASNYSAMFLSMWNLCNENENLDYNKFIVKHLDDNHYSKGYLLPFNDGPDNDVRVARNLYIQMITNAKKYIYITTPYLALDNEFTTALINSAKSGIDVRIITPYIPDKKLIHKVTRSFYNVLLEAGVKIYEYTPGFIHSKTIVIDDELAVVGTINLDFRSLYFHYECASWIYKTGVELSIREDFINTQKISNEIVLNEWKKRGKFKTLLDKILITFSSVA